MVYLRHWSKLLFVATLALLLAACIPLASFSINPEPVKVGVLTTFDASSSSASSSPKGNSIVSYAWDFGDGSRASGKIATHRFTQVGVFTVKLTVVDKAGRSSTSSERVKVQAADPDTQRQLKVSVQNANGVDLSGAVVSVGAIQATTDGNGQASLAVQAGATESVLSVRKNGYVTQVVRLALASNGETSWLTKLAPVKDTLQIAQIQEPAVYGSSVLAASVSLPGNALVIAGTNTLATGAATLQLTPWDISGDDLLAMPGNGRARAADGSLVDLISAGMMTVDFFDRNGNKLQLAAGRTATIQMDLPFASINGTPLSLGDRIPMWNFSEAEGLWIEEGMGTVVQGSIASPTGLAVSAVVSHFSTWNWDFKFDNPGSVTVSCVDDEGALVACNVIADVRLDDGSRFTKSASLPAAVTEVINMPNDGSIAWSATSTEGLIGQTTSSTTGNVTIQIGTPTTNNFVRCLLPNNTGVSCHVTLSLDSDSDGAVTQQIAIPAEGATVRTTWTPTGSLQWTAQSDPTTNATNQLALYTGIATSGASGTASIALGNEQLLPSRVVRFQCDTEADYYDRFNEVTQVLPLDRCDVSGAQSERRETPLEGRSAYQFNNLPAGSVVSVMLPASQDSPRFFNLFAYGDVTHSSGSILRAGVGSTIDLALYDGNSVEVLRLGTSLTRPPIDPQ